MSTLEIINTVNEINIAEELETTGFRQCHICHYELRERDKFCRQCGSRQYDQATNSSLNRYLTASQTHDLLVTSALMQPYTTHLVSGVLMTGIIASAHHSTSQLRSTIAKQLISALIAVPLWLIIVLLSPFDAYVTAKAVSGQS